MPAPSLPLLLLLVSLLPLLLLLLLPPLPGEGRPQEGCCPAVSCGEAWRSAYPAAQHRTKVPLHLPVLPAVAAAAAQLPLRLLLSQPVLQLSWKALGSHPERGQCCREGEQGKGKKSKPLRHSKFLRQGHRHMHRCRQLFASIPSERKNPGGSCRHRGHGAHGCAYSNNGSKRAWAHTHTCTSQDKKHSHLLRPRWKLPAVSKLAVGEAGMPSGSSCCSGSCTASERHVSSPSSAACSSADRRCCSCNCHC